MSGGLVVRSLRLLINSESPNPAKPRSDSQPDSALPCTLDPDSGTSTKRASSDGHGSVPRPICPPVTAKRVRAPSAAIFEHDWLCGPTRTTLTSSRIRRPHPTTPTGAPRFGHFPIGGHRAWRP